MNARDRGRREFGYAIAEAILIKALREVLHVESH